jgi:hypothetical protein
MFGSDNRELAIQMIIVMMTVVFLDIRGLKGCMMAVYLLLLKFHCIKREE